MGIPFLLLDRMTVAGFGLGLCFVVIVLSVHYQIQIPLALFCADGHEGVPEGFFQCSAFTCRFQPSLCICVSERFLFCALTSSLWGRLLSLVTWCWGVWGVFCPSTGHRQVLCIWVSEVGFSQKLCPSSLRLLNSALYPVWERIFCSSPTEGRPLIGSWAQS